jgi:hypothetical protein
LNPRPLGYEPNELPDCSTPRQRNTHRSVADDDRQPAIATDGANRGLVTSAIMPVHGLL